MFLNAREKLLLRSGFVMKFPNQRFYTFEFTVGATPSARRTGGACPLSASLTPDLHGHQSDRRKRKGLICTSVCIFPISSELGQVHWMFSFSSLTYPLCLFIFLFFVKLSYRLLGELSLLRILTLEETMTVFLQLAISLLTLLAMWFVTWMFYIFIVS